MSGEEDEFQLLTVDTVFVFKVPPRTSAEGYSAADWGKEVWVGELKVASKGPNCIIRLTGRDGRLFAVCVVKPDGPPAVEKVKDSSRYFVLRIEDGKGRQAYIGLGFQQRSEAFDFNAALADHAKPSDSIDYGDMPDLSMKSGETIRIKVPMVTGTAAGGPTATQPTSSTTSGGIGGGFKLGGGLAPPTSSGRSKYGVSGPPPITSTVRPTGTFTTGSMPPPTARTGTGSGGSTGTAEENLLGL